MNMNMYDAGLPYVHDNKPESDSESENDEKKSGKENLSMAKLASILKQIDEISDFISDSDPNVKVKKILEDSLDSISSPLPSVKMQNIGGKVCLRCKGKTLLDLVNKLLKTKCLLTTPSNVLPLCLTNFPAHNLNLR